MSSFLFRRSTAAAGVTRRAFSTTPRNQLARLQILGNLGDAPELVQVQGGREIVRYIVASNTGPRDNRQTSWFRVASFAEGKQKDYLLSLPKGSQVFVEGDATMNTYTDQEGTVKSALNIVQRNIEVVRRGKTGAEGEEEHQ